MDPELETVTEAPAAGLLGWLEATPLAKLVREDVWLYPGLETLHIVGIALVFGCILAYDLRVLGRGKGLEIARLGHHLLPLVWIGFVVNATTGMLLFISDAVEFGANPALQAKLALIVAAGLNAAYFQARLAPRLSTAVPDTPLLLPARLSAFASIVLWLAVITAGRMMAYIK